MMWTINNCSIVSTTPTYRQQSVAGSATICRTDQPKFIFSNNNLKAENRCGTRSSFVSSVLQLISGRLSTPPLNIKLIKYADYITVYTFGPVGADLISGLDIYLSQVLNYINNKKLTSTVTHLTPDTREHHIHPHVKLADHVLQLEKKPRVLGVTFDTHLTFTQHCNSIAVNMQHRNNVLKALAGCTWGGDKETLLTRQLAVQYSATASPSGRHHPRTLTGAGSNGRIFRCGELPLAVLKLQMSQNCIKKLKTSCSQA